MQCYGHDKECFLCGVVGHVKGAANCSGKKAQNKKPKKTRRVKDKKKELSDTSSSRSDTESSVCLEK